MNTIKEWQKELEVKDIKQPLSNLQFFQDKNRGLTLAKCDHDGGKFIRVAAAYCGENDKWKNKQGKYAAVHRLMNGKYILIPKIGGGKTAELILLFFYS